MSNWRAETQSINVTQEQVDSSLQCSICLEDYSLRENVLRLKCAHFFHDCCITPWFDQNIFCPVCRAVRFNQPSSNSIPTPGSLAAQNEDPIIFESYVTSLESDSEESYFDEESFINEDDIFFDESMSDQSEEEDLEYEDLIGMEEDDNVGTQSDNVELQSDNGFEEDNSDETNEEISMSDESFFEAETESIFFSDDDFDTEP